MARVGFWPGGRRETAARASLTGVSEAAEELIELSNSALPSKAEALLLLKTYEESHEGWFWSTDKEGRLTYVSNPVTRQLSAAGHALVGRPFTELFVPAEEGTRAARTLPFILTKRTKFEKLSLHTAVPGAERWWSISGSPHFDSGGNFAGYRGNGVDITEQRRSSEHASRLAMYDALTGLSNRHRMSEVLEANLLALEVQKRACAIMLIDLDRFKQVNDTLGHPAGDALLQQVAERLLKIVGDKEAVFRLGGDEFQIIMRGCEDRGILGDTATHIIASLSQPYSVGGSRCIIGASLGIAVSPYDGRTSDELIRNADLALYAAKEGGRGRFHFFSSALLQAAEDRRILEEDLRDALVRGEIELFYQPIVDIRSNCTAGVEALVRWHHPERGPISPALFIPIAEEANLIEQLGEWVLRKACEDAATWPGKLRVAVNVSPIQFANDGFPAIVLSALASSGLSPDRLELEITEGVFLSESAATDTMFATLKEVGVRLALDDFGTGYSSLSYLRTAPFDKIKIDQSFVREATLPQSRNRAIIAAIVALAEAMGMETTAEGIESHDQLELVRTLRVSHAQGFIYSKAIHHEKMTDRLASGDWIIAPSGPAKQRSERHSMYRNVGAIYGNYYRSVLIRNLSESGALLEGLVGVPVGSLLLIDFGEGQLAFAHVRRAKKNQHGIEFEQQLVNDGSGGLCTSHRASQYLLSQAGLPSTYVGTNPGKAATPDALRAQLGGHFAAPAAAPALPRGSGPGDTAPDVAADSNPRFTPPGGTVRQRERPVADARDTPTMKQLAGRYLDHVKSDRQRYDIDHRFLQDDILPRFGGLRPEDVAPSQIAAWLSAKVTNDGYSSGQVTRLQGILGQMYVLAMQWGGAGGESGGDAMQGISLFSRRDGERCLGEEEIERLNKAVSASRNPQLKYIVSLLMQTGARQRELMEAKWSDVDLKAGIWRVRGSRPGKFRQVVLSKTAIDTMGRLPRWNGCDHLIANPKTKKPYRTIFNSWDAARRTAELFDVEIDDLRHSAPSEARPRAATPIATRQ